MNGTDWVRVIGLLGPIVALIILGFGLAIRSGVGQMATPSGARRAFENVSGAVLLVVGCLLGLAVIHQLVGQRVGVIW